MRFHRLLLLSAIVVLPSCARVTLDQTKPIEINVNVRLQVDRELDQFFAFQNKYDPATQPATQPLTQSNPSGS